LQASVIVLSSLPIILAELDGLTKDANTLVLEEKDVLGGGAFSRVSVVKGES